MHHVYDETPDEEPEFPILPTSSETTVPYKNHLGRTEPLDIREQTDTTQYRYNYYTVSYINLFKLVLSVDNVDIR